MVQYNLQEGLLTSNAVSEAVTAGRCLASIMMFSVIYGLLFWIWLYVLNDKIQKGPKPVVILGPRPRRMARSNRGTHAARGIDVRSEGPPAEGRTDRPMDIARDLVSPPRHCCSPDMRCSTASISAWEFCTRSPRPTTSGGCSSTRSARSGMAMRYGWWCSAARCSQRFPRRTRPCSQASIWRSCCCCSR